MVQPKGNEGVWLSENEQLVSAKAFFFKVDQGKCYVLTVFIQCSTSWVCNSELNVWLIIIS